MGPMMLQSDGITGASLQDFEAWKDLLERLCGGYRSECIAPKAFHGWVRPLNVCGLTAMDVGCNARRGVHIATFVATAWSIIMLCFKSPAIRR
jgi:hypothetical protein